MRILVSNDDGYLAPGLRALADALCSVADVVVVAPERNRSGASNSLTLSRPLRVNRASSGFYFVDGTPTDCVHLALFGVLREQPDLVVSGINAGANLGDDVIYSGTVAAAMEGRFLGLPAIAVSLVSEQPTHYAAAAQVAKDMVTNLSENTIPGDTILNVNVPDLPYGELAGFEVARLGSRHQAEPVIAMPDPRGNGSVYWIGATGAEHDAGPGTDFHAVREGKVAVTPLHTDLTRTTAMDSVTAWLERLAHP
ncbi:MAG: 5'/3'-nucleotidase SurE [Gammaproteobacteria bacterium]|nr:5'/3'-nucleotidase SurE [Gammaproteobacteria bacterium]